MRAIVYLAMNPGKAFTTQQISLTTKVPAAYLSKVMQLLVRARLVQSQRGLGGGFVLAKAPEEINILAVLNAVDPIQRIRACPLGLKAHGTTLCALHKKLLDQLDPAEDPELGLLSRIADALDEYVRWEEHSLFPSIEQSLDAEQMQQLSDATVSKDPAYARVLDKLKNTGNAEFNPRILKTFFLQRSYVHSTIGGCKRAKRIGGIAK